VAGGNHAARAQTIRENLTPARLAAVGNVAVSPTFAKSVGIAESWRHGFLHSVISMAHFGAGVRKSESPKTLFFTNCLSAA